MLFLGLRLSDGIASSTYNSLVCLENAGLFEVVELLLSYLHSLSLNGLSRFRGRTVASNFS